MLLHTKAKHVYTVDHYEYTEGTTDQEGVIYVYKETLAGTLSPGRTQTYLFLPMQLPVGDVILNAKDKNGTPIFTRRGENYRMYINESAPVFDIFGNLVQYRHTLRQKAPVEAGLVGHSG